MKLIIFDVDGTLVDSQNNIVAAQRAAFAAHGLEPPTRERSLSIVGLSLAEAFTALVGPKGPIEGLARAYREAFRELRADPAHREPLFPGALEALGRLARRDHVLLGIATGKSRRGVAHLLDRHGWHGVFATIQTADDAPSKPDPAMIQQALAEVGAAPGEAVMVGDTSFDMAMAQAAGVRPIGVAWGYHPIAALREAGAREVVESFAALESSLERFLGQPSPGASARPI